MKEKARSFLKLIRAKVIALIVLTIFIGGIYNAADKKVVVEESKYDFSKFKKGSFLVMRGDSNKVFDWITIHNNFPSDSYLEGEFLLNRWLNSSVQVPSLTYENLNQLMRQRKLTVQLWPDSTVSVKEIIRVQLGNKHN